MKTKEEIQAALKVVGEFIESGTEEARCVLAESQSIYAALSWCLGDDAPVNVAKAGVVELFHILLISWSEET